MSLHANNVLFELLVWHKRNSSVYFFEISTQASVVIFNATWTRNPNPIGLNNTKELKPKFLTSWCIENDSRWQPANNRPQLADANEREKPKGSSQPAKTLLKNITIKLLLGYRLGDFQRQTLAKR
jgi:hypothetical protein